MSRVLSDRSIIRLAQVGCGLSDEGTLSTCTCTCMCTLLFSFFYFTSSECRLLKWTKWRTGMILRFGNVTLLSMEELSGKLFTGNGTKMSIMKDGGRWEDHPLDTTVYGVNVEVKRGREERREEGRERRKGGRGWNKSLRCSYLHVHVIYYPFFYNYCQCLLLNIIITGP